MSSKSNLIMSDPVGSSNVEIWSTVGVLERRGEYICAVAAAVKVVAEKNGIELTNEELATSVSESFANRQEPDGQLGSGL